MIYLLKRIVIRINHDVLRNQFRGWLPRSTNCVLIWLAHERFCFWFFYFHHAYDESIYNLSPSTKVSQPEACPQSTLSDYNRPIFPSLDWLDFPSLLQSNLLSLIWVDGNVSNANNQSTYQSIHPSIHPPTSSTWCAYLLPIYSYREE